MHQFLSGIRVEIQRSVYIGLFSKCYKRLFSALTDRPELPATNTLAYFAPPSVKKMFYGIDTKFERQSWKKSSCSSGLLGLLFLPRLLRFSSKTWWCQMLCLQEILTEGECSVQLTSSSRSQLVCAWQSGQPYWAFPFFLLLGYSCYRRRQKFCMLTPPKVFGTKGLPCAIKTLQTPFTIKLIDSKWKVSQCVCSSQKMKSLQWNLSFSRKLRIRNFS